MAAAGGSWHRTSSKGSKNEYFVFAKSGESKRKAVNRYKKEGARFK